MLSSDLDKYIRAIKELEGMFDDLRPAIGVNSIAPQELDAECDEPALECNHAVFQMNDTFFWFVLNYRKLFCSRHRPITVTLRRISGKLEAWNDYRSAIDQELTVLAENEYINKIEVELVTNTFRLLDDQYKNQHLPDMDAATNVEEAQ